jgi:type II secretory pathway component GspD/PulD (secretin)
LAPTIKKIEIEATIIETLAPQRPDEGILPQTIAISGRGPCPACGQIHSPGSVPFGHASDGWFEMNEGVRCGVSTMDPELIIARLQQVSQATVTSNPRVEVLSRQVAEIGLTEKQGFRRISIRDRGEKDHYALLQGGVELALRPTLEEDGVIRLDLNPLTTAATLSAASTDRSTSSSASLSVPPGSCVVIGGLDFGIERATDIASRSKRIGSILTGKFSDNEIREVVIVIRVRQLNESETVASPASLSIESNERESPAPLLIPTNVSPIPQ